MRSSLTSNRHLTVEAAKFMTDQESAKTPDTLGLSMPAEWEPHEATWLGWPHHPTDWLEKLDTIRWVYGEIVRHIARGEIVRVLLDSKAEQQLANRYLHRAGADLDRVEVLVNPTNPGTPRGTGPLSVR